VEATVQRNITFDLIGHAQTRPDAPALLLPHRTIGFRKLDQKVWQYAAALHAQGVRAGQVVGLSFVEELGLVLTLLALARLGATAYSIPRSATPSQRQQMAQRAAIAWLASDQPERFECGVASLRLERQAIEASPARIDKRLLAPAPDAPLAADHGFRFDRPTQADSGQSCPRARQVGTGRQGARADRIRPGRGTEPFRLLDLEVPPA
jgi:acyl-CoA synthetase (AMP-forming)/AMP-acid ligase II